MWELTAREFELMRRGWNMQRSYNLEGDRMISYFIASAFRGDKTVMPSMDKWMPLFHEESAKDVVKSVDDLKDRRQQLKEYYSKYFGKEISA